MKYESDILLLLSFYFLIGYTIYFPISELKSANICFIYFGELLFNIIYCKYLYYELKLTTFYESYIIHIYFDKKIHYFQNIKFKTFYYLSKMHTQLTYLFNLLFSFNVGRQ